MNSTAAWAKKPLSTPSTRSTASGVLIGPNDWRARSSRCRRRSRPRCGPMIVPAVLCLAVLLSACASQPIVHTVPVEKKVRQWVPVPAERIAPLDVPRPPPGLLWGESLQLNAILYGVVEQCQADRLAIRRLNERTTKHTTQKE